MKIFLIVVTVLVVIGVIGGSLGFYFTKNMVKVPNQFVSLLANDYPDQAYELFSADQKKEFSYEDFIELITSSLSSKPKSVVFNSREVKNDYGKVSGTLTLENGNLFSIVMELEKEDTGWRITYLSWKPLSK